jgi:ubiquinone/menaquinone biosynthesis C-methylase UbiE
MCIIITIIGEIMKVLLRDDPDIKENIRVYWNERSKTFDQDVGHGADRYECLLWKKHLTDIIGSGPKTILDVGTGTGMIAINLAELGHTVTGIDLCEDMLEEAEKKAIFKGLSITFLQRDAENPGFPDQMYDAVICRHLLWTLPHPDNAIREWSRICRPGGVIIAIDGHLTPRDCFGNTDDKDESEMDERQKLWKEMYSPEIIKHLPFGKDLTMDYLASFFTENGLSEITFRHISEISQYQKKILREKNEDGEDCEVNIIWGRVPDL